MKKVLAWIFGIVLGIIGCGIVYEFNQNFVDLLPRWFVIVTSIIPFITSIVASYNCTEGLYCGISFSWFDFWEDVREFAKLFLIVAVSVLVLVATAFVCSLVAYAIKDGAWIFAIILIAVLSSGGCIIIRIFEW